MWSILGGIDKPPNGNGEGRWEDLTDHTFNWSKINDSKADKEVDFAEEYLMESLKTMFLKKHGIATVNSETAVPSWRE
ncbi:unnamed protein product [Echinostoma caproni]|uniref:AGC-kinase C-terminal domain-containing protein n=1 Tax=Echinostoma caproni TaxID=27848 RepID=A0A183AWF5_9TREM|nr:unnamed protein product [Echinostoma caproni]